MTSGRPSPPAGQARRIAAEAAGWGLLTVGAALMVLPGPGIPLVLAGLVVLGRERPWARRLHQRLKEQMRLVARRLRQRVKERRGRRPTSNPTRSA